LNAALQPELAGLDLPPVQTPAPDDLARFAVNGRLVTDVVLRTRPGPRVVLEALIEQRAEHHPRALRVLCKFLMPDEGSFDDTQAAARRHAVHLRAGAEVMAVGRGLEIRQHQGEDVFSYIHGDGIGAIDKAAGVGA
jgi:hypothetical protein